MVKKLNIVGDTNTIKYNPITIIFNNIINTNFIHFSFFNNLDIVTLIIAINMAGIIIQGIIAPNNTSIQNLIGGSWASVNNEENNIINVIIINPILLVNFSLIN